MFIILLCLYVSCYEMYASSCSTETTVDPACISESIQSYGKRYESAFRQQYDSKPRHEWPFQFDDPKLLGYLREIPMDVNDQSLQPVFEALTEHFKKSPPSSILEIGCGSARLSFELLERYPALSVVASDINEGVIKDIPKNPRLTPLVFDATKVESFPTNTTFDAIVSVGAIRYFQDQEKAKQLSKLLNPGGLAIFVDYLPFAGGELIGLRNVPRLTAFYILLHLYKTDPLFKQLTDSKPTQFHKTLLQIAGSTMLETYAMIQKAPTKKEELVDQLENINKTSINNS